MRPHEEHAKYEPLEQAAEQAARFLTALIQNGTIPDVVFGYGDTQGPVDAPLDPTQPWDAQAEDVRDALLAALVRTGYAGREAQNKVLRERLAKASQAHHQRIGE